MNESALHLIEGIFIAVAVLSIFVLIYQQKRIEKYLKSHHPAVFVRIYLNTQEGYRDDEGLNYFPEFIEKGYKQLNDQNISELVHEYKLFKVCAFLSVVALIGINIMWQAFI